jgi:two-component system OmpR family sensor kinase
MKRALTIRAKITLGSAAVAIVVIAIAGVVIRLNAAATLHASDVSVATTDLASFEKDLTANRGEHVDPPGTGVLVLLRAPSGQTAETTLPHDIGETVARMKPSNSIFSAGEDGAPYVVVSQTVTTPDGTWGLWAARSTASSNLVLAGLDGQIILGGLLALIAFSAASFLLATVALRPVTAMRRRAETLQGTGEDERLPVGAARDELSALAMTLNEFLDRVNDSTQREKRMVSDAAHELRTPLAALRTQLELAHDDFGDPEALGQEIVGAERSVSRLTALANGMLELSRLEGSEQLIEPTNANALLDQTMGAVDRARMLALSKKVEVTFATEGLDGESRYAIAGDAFSRLLDNLLSNAITAAREEGSVEISLVDSRGALEILVVDDGPGVPESFLPVAFDRFTRPDESRSAQAGGSGLGLALVRAIAESAGGSAELRNREFGAIARVVLPKM